jgi:membrane-associated phospholipid phosphatase
MLNRQPENTRGFHLLMGSVVASLITFDWALGRPLLPEPGFPQLWAILLALALYSQWRKLHRLREFAIMVIWMSLLTHGLNLLTQLAATSPAPLVDRQLAGLDTALRCSTLSVVVWLRFHDALRMTLYLAYAGLRLLALLAVMVPILQGRFRESQQYVLAVTIAAVLAIGLFAIWPAVGPWVVYGYQPRSNQAHSQAVLLALKQYHQPPRDGIAAIVSFPSFHVVLALLSAAALWSNRRARPLLAVLTAAICFSTVATGWHYVTDVLGGLAVAPAAYLVAAGLLCCVPMEQEKAGLLWTVKRSSRPVS